LKNRIVTLQGPNERACAAVPFPSFLIECCAQGMPCGRIAPPVSNDPAAILLERAERAKIGSFATSIRYVKVTIHRV
jgi:hypothetical protein